MNSNFTQRLVDKNLNFEDLERDLKSLNKGSKVPTKYWNIFSDFIKSYFQIASQNQADFMTCKKVITSFAQVIIELANNPQPFQHFHTAVRTPFDYYALGLDLLRPIVDLQHSHLKGLDQLKEIQKKLDKKENVFLFANHQSEADPQLISLLLEPYFPKLAEDMIFVAGQRVVTDPLAVPASLGRNLLCIYSKKYFDFEKEKRAQMQEHNKKAIQILANLIDEGGKCIYIAPSGGRDRRNPEGIFTVAPFDPQSIQLCRLIGTKSKRPTHFYPLALRTHGILPPPDGLQVELGEKRTINTDWIAAGFGNAISFTEYTTLNKEERKQQAALYAWNLVNDLYGLLSNKSVKST
jgi:glycerol-3-phosphate O-acyltransferase